MVPAKVVCQDVVGADVLEDTHVDVVKVVLVDVVDVES